VNPTEPNGDAHGHAVPLFGDEILRDNRCMARTPLKPTAPTKKAVKKAPATKVKAVLLSGGNPQISIGEGDEPVQAYIDAMPGWKRDVGRNLDALVVRTVPGIKKAVKWNSPFYGVEGQGWMLSFHCLTKYIKAAFFDGASLRPVPPETSKSDDVRYLHLFENDKLDEAQFCEWLQQASALPGWSKA
jgi:hypothetical protein